MTIVFERSCKTWHFEATEADFRNMRALVLMGHTATAAPWIYEMVNIFDDVRAMKPGDKKYIASSKNGAWAKSSLVLYSAEFNRMTEFSGKEGYADFKPDIHYCIEIRRAIKGWILETLEAQNM